MQYSTDELKRKLRNLKKLEVTLRTRLVHDGNVYPLELIWDRFFSTSDKKGQRVKYPLEILIPMTRSQFKEIIEEYFYWVYYQNFKENGLLPSNLYDPNLLSLLGLPPSASLEDIKHRFRELAKKYHPDLGGNSENFIEMVDIYHRLVDSIT